ncbi:MAG: metallophosphoesterase family protein [Ruminococcus sp.]|nr:metallophosphoesterase family protein [Candidatus Copronaster equi]
MEKEPLRFKNGKFKIMLIGDLHEHYDTKSENDAKQSEDMVALLNKSMETLKPDLVIYMGDNVDGDDIPQLRAVISRIVRPAESRNIPFSLIFGNHDRERKVDLETQMKLFNEHENCYFFNADKKIRGLGNFNLLVKASESDDDILNLWFIDSGSNSEDPLISVYDWVHSDQIEWYKKTAAKIKKEHNGKTIPSFVFQHIPVPEEYELLREAKAYEFFDSVVGHDKWSDKRYVLKQHIEGYMGEAPRSPSVNSGEFDAWKEVGDVMGAFFGHDHMNDFVGYVDSIMLGQCKTAGFRPYTDGCRTGVRLITVDENNVENFTTRMYYFKKDFGLKSKSLDLYMRNINDRQDLKLKAVGKAAGAVAAVTATAIAVNKLKNKK